MGSYLTYIPSIITEEYMEMDETISKLKKNNERQKKIIENYRKQFTELKSDFAIYKKGAMMEISEKDMEIFILKQKMNEITQMMNKSKCIINDIKKHNQINTTNKTNVELKNEIIELVNKIKTTKPRNVSI